jgi:hypothetical protein
MTSEEFYEHTVRAWTVGQLRAALNALPDDLPIVVDAAEEAGGDTVYQQVIVHVGFGHGIAGDRTEFIGRELRIGCELPSGNYHQRCL